MKEIKEETGRCLYQINSCLRKQRELLSQSSKESRLTFSYKDEKELLKGQTVLIDLGFKILEFMDEDREDIANDCWLLLSTLIKRGELTLAMIGYSKSQQESAKNEPSSFLKRKHKISLKYQQLMN